MLKFEIALKKVLDKTKILNPEEVPLDKSVDCVLAENIKASIDLPPFNKSAMDGYALRSIDLKSIPQQLKCLGTVKPGKVFKREIKKGECAKIMTGSAMPEGSDSVIMIEFTEKDRKPGGVRVLKGTQKSENVCFKGEDVKKGTDVLKKGMLLRGPEVAIAAALGRKKLKVYRKPRVAILNTGDEIVQPGKNLAGNKIYNSNGPMLLSLLSSIDIEVDYLGIVKDKKEDLRKMIKKGLRDDIFLLSGGVSMGEFDLVPKVLKECTVKQVFHKISMKPGKPVFFGTKKSGLIFGIPGNPVSTYLIFLVLIKTVIEKMMGRIAHLDIRRGILKEDFKQKPDKRKHFIPAKVFRKGKQLYVFPIKGYHGSADIASLSLANAFMIVEGTVSFLKKNSRVQILLW